MRLAVRPALERSEELKFEFPVLLVKRDYPGLFAVLSRPVFPEQA